MHKTILAFAAVILLAPLTHAGVGPTNPWPHAAVPCRPADATFTPGDNNFAALDTAIETAKRNPGADRIATVRVPPGTYALRYADRGAFQIVMDLGSVELCGDGGIASFHMADGQFRFMLNRLGVLYFKNLSFDGAWPGLPSARSFEIVNTQITNTAFECVFWSEDPADEPNGEDPVDDSYGLIYQSKFDGCRSTNATGHSMYLDRRGCSFYAIESEFRAQGTLEVWRSLCRFNYIANNYISNVRDIRAPVVGKVSPAFDFPSCGLTIFKRNLLESVGNGPALTSRQRRSISGCDMPNQRELEDTGMAGDRPYPGETAPKVQQRSFWRAIQSGAMPNDPGVTGTALLTNPALMPLILWENELVAYGPVSTAAAVVIYSSAAMDADGDDGGTSNSEYLKVPFDAETPDVKDGWNERHYALFVGNTVRGWPKLWSGTYNVEVDPTTKPEVQAWVRDVLRAQLLPRGFELPAVPSQWMPDTNDPRLVCDYWSARVQWPDETPDREGFPRCDAASSAATPVPMPPDDVRIDQ